MRLFDCWVTPWRSRRSGNTLRLRELNKCSADRISQIASVPCCPKMAVPVPYKAAAAGSNYWLGCGKWGQMYCIIREPVDSRSPSQWFVINKIIGERWQRFREFFLICMSFCTKFFMTSFFICEGWVANDTVSHVVICSRGGFKLSLSVKQHVWVVSAMYIQFIIIQTSWYVLFVPLLITCIFGGTVQNKRL